MFTATVKLDAEEIMGDGEELVPTVTVSASVDQDDSGKTVFDYHVLKIEGVWDVAEELPAALIGRIEQAIYRRARRSCL